MAPDERGKVLQLLSEGKINVEEAETLLRALDATTSPAPPTPPVPPVPPVPPTPPSPAHWSDLGDQIRRAVEQAVGIGLSAAAGAEDAVRVERRVIRKGKGRVGKRPKLEQIMQLAAHDITPDYVRGIREAGLTDLTLDEVVQLGIHDVTPQYVKAMRKRFPSMTVRDVVNCAIHDVTPDYVAAMHDLGYEELTLRNIVELAIHDVSPDYVRKLVEAGFEDLSFQELLQLAVNDVDPDAYRAFRELDLSFGDEDGDVEGAEDVEADEAIDIEADDEPVEREIRMVVQVSEEEHEVEDDEPAGEDDDR